VLSDLVWTFSEKRKVFLDFTHPPNGSCYFEPNLFLYYFLFLVHSTHIYLPMKMEQTECSKTSAYKLQTPGNYPKESIQQREKLLAVPEIKPQTIQFIA
jgi:hypothetical protein